MACVIYRLPRILIGRWALPTDVRGIGKLLHTFTSRTHLIAWTGSALLTILGSNIDLVYVLRDIVFDYLFFTCSGHAKS